MKANLSLKTQLILIILTVTLFSTTLSFAFSIIYDYFNSRNSLKNNMCFTAELIAENIKSPMLFNDNFGAKDLLLTFQSIPVVRKALVVDTNGVVFASYSDTSQDCIDSIMSLHTSEYSYFDKGLLYISLPIKQDNLRFGTFIMYVSADEINKKLFISAGIFFLMLFIIMVVSYFISLKLQLIISNPILELKDLAEKITLESNYALRIPHTYQNEIGQLQKSFDTMVQQLNKYVDSLKNEIIDRKRSQQETMHLRLYLKNIIDSLSSIIISIDSEGRIRLLNTAAINFIGRESETVVNYHVTDVLAVIKENENYLKLCLEKRDPQNFVTIYSQPGISQPNHLNIRMYPLNQNANEGIVIVVDDITEKNRMESMMIQNEKMISLGGLAAGMAHEINNPLGIISQGVQNILRHVSMDQPRNHEIAKQYNLDLSALNEYLEKRKVIHYLQGILTASKRASEIVANMLQFSRMSNQSKSLGNINDIIDTSIELAQNEYELKKKFDFRQIKIIKEYDSSIPNILCNFTEIQQVLLNLLKNAAHALYDKKGNDFIPQITIRTKNENSFLKIEIEDNGPGIPEDFRKRVFEPFFTTKEVGIGTGLGLSVSFFIITKNHSGTIDLETSVGAGTRFIIRLPITEH